MFLFQEVLEEAGIDIFQAAEEWPDLRREISRRYQDLTSASWENLNNLNDRFPNALGVIDFILSLPSHSADCERGFSLMKRVKSDWRSTLDNKTLTNLMRICLSSPSIGHFDPEPAIQFWHVNGERARRPNTSPYGSRQRKESSESSSESDSD